MTEKLPPPSRVSSEGGGDGDGSGVSTEKPPPPSRVSSEGGGGDTRRREMSLSLRHVGSVEVSKSN